MRSMWSLLLILSMATAAEAQIAISANDNKVILVGNMVERNVQVLRWDDVSLKDNGERIHVNGGSAALRLADKP